MKRLRAFSPVELVMLFVALSLIGAILLPSCMRARELSRRVVCASNLKEIGTALYLYANDGDRFPMIGDKSHTSAATYWYYRLQKPRKSPRSPTADLWQLIRQHNATPALFICPSTTDVPDAAQDALDYFDFASGVNLSYAYQFQHNENRPGLTTGDDPTLPLAADANPYIKGGVDTTAAADRHTQARGNSRNHTNREGENTLFLDSHVDFLRSPDAGPSGRTMVRAEFGPRWRDNMYALHRAGDFVDPGVTDGFPDRIELGDRSDICLVP
jgi:hypothetical protein